MHQVGPYTIEDEVARGGAGVVYRARDRAGRQVALKVLLRGGPAGNVARFRREVAALAQLQHPGIVRLHDVGATDTGHPYLVMDFIQGATLDARLRQGPLPVARALEVVQELAAALGLAHAQGIVHRDVKPANVIVRSDGRALLTDFGLAMEDSGQHSLTQAGNMLGTPGFMPPEQVMGSLAELGPPADVYSLGATLYACLTGQAPFEGDPFEVLTATTARPPRPPSALRPGIPREVDALCLRCLEKEPAARFADAGELGLALEQCVRLEAAPRPRRGRWLLTALLLVAAAGAGYAAWLQLRGPGPALYAELRELGHAGRADAMLERLEPLLREHPDAPLLLSYAGRAHVLRRDYELGLPLLERACELAPETAEVWLHLAIAQIHTDPEAAPRSVDRSLALAPTAPGYTVRAWLLIRDRRFAAAEADLDRAEAVDPTYAHLLPTRATLFAQLGDPEAALRCLDRAAREAPLPETFRMRAQVRQALHHSPAEVLAEYAAGLAHADDVETYEQRARYLTRLGRYAEAESDWTRALELRPRTVASWLSRADLRRRHLDRQQGALEDAQRALALAPGDRTARLSLALGLHATARDHEAEAELDRLLEEDPQDRGARFTRSRVRLALERYPEAYADAMQLLTVTPDAPEVLEVASSAAGLLGRPDALALAERYLAAAPRARKALENYAQALWLLNAREELLEFTERAARESPELVSPMLRVYHAAAINSQGRHDEARAILERVLVDAPRTPLALLFLGRQALDQGRWASAKERLEALRELRPQSAEAHLLHARACFELGDLAGARQSLGLARRHEALLPPALAPHYEALRARVEDALGR